MSKHRGRKHPPKFTQEIRDMLRADGCPGKVAYSERTDATDAQHGMASKGKSVKVYVCPACGKYHLSSNKSHGRRKSNGH